MNEDEPLFVVDLPRSRMLPRLILCLGVPYLVLVLLGGRVPYLAAVVIPLFLIGFLSWLLIFRARHCLEVREDFLIYRYALYSKQAMFTPAEIGSAEFRGFFPLRRLILTGRGGERLAALEADSENMDKLTEYLEKNHISIR